LPLRIVVVTPPIGVAFALRDRKDELVDRTISKGDDITFELGVRVKRIGRSPPRFLGPFTFGTTSERFVYIRIGTLAGQADSCWTRAAKVSLSSISWDLIDQARKIGAKLEARFGGRAKDGGPSCACVSFLDGGWSVKR
jgi:hypothetical protein